MHLLYRSGCVASIGRLRLIVSPPLLADTAAATTTTLVLAAAAVAAVLPAAVLPTVSILPQRALLLTPLSALLPLPSLSQCMHSMLLLLHCCGYKWPSSTTV